MHADKIFATELMGAMGRYVPGFLSTTVVKSCHCLGYTLILKVAQYIGPRWGTSKSENFEYTELGMPSRPGALWGLMCEIALAICGFVIGEKGNGWWVFVIVIGLSHWS